MLVNIGFEGSQAGVGTTRFSNHPRIEYGGGFKYLNLGNRRQVQFQSLHSLDDLAIRPQYQPAIQQPQQRQQRQHQFSEEEQPSREVMHYQNCQLHNKYGCGIGHSDGPAYYTTYSWGTGVRGQVQGVALQRTVRRQPMEELAPAPPPPTPLQPVAPLQVVEEVRKKRPQDFKLSQSKPGIRSEHVLRYVLQHQNQLNQALGFRFKAKEVPPQCKGVLLDKIEKEKEDRRQQLTQEVKNKHQKVKTFSFVDRPRKQVKTFEEYYKTDYKFQALPLPKHILQPKQRVFEQQAEARRQEAIGKTSVGSLPSRMEKAKRVQEARRVSQLQFVQKFSKQYNYSFKPAPVKEVPNFSRMHRNMQNRLQQHKSKQHTTLNPPNLSQGRNKVHCQFNQPCSESIVRRPYSSMKFSGCPAKSTLKHEALAALRRTERTKAFQKQEQREKQLEHRVIKKVKPTPTRAQVLQQETWESISVVEPCPKCLQTNKQANDQVPRTKSQVWRTDFFDPIL